MTATQHMHTVHGRCSGLLSTEKFAKVLVDMFSECLQTGVQLVQVSNFTVSKEGDWGKTIETRCLDSQSMLSNAKF